MKRFWSRICGFVSEHDLFFRLFLILFGCIILPVSIACIAFNWQAENLVRTQTERTNSAYLTSLSTQLEILVSHVLNDAFSILKPPSPFNAEINVS